MKKLMIVGASVLQMPAIKKAKEMGLEVAVVDYDPAAAGIRYADRYYNASTMDEDAVVKAAEDFRPDGIMTLATDMPMRGVAKASDRLHLHSIDYGTAVRATDKHEMMRAFREHGVPSPRYFPVRSFDGLKELEGKLTYPCIMKPVDNAGSHGVVKVESFGQLLESYDYSHGFSRSGNVIVEEFLDGPEVSVEVMVVEGRVNVLQITDKLTTGAPYFVEMGHSQPSMLPESTQAAVCSLARRACRAVGLRKGPAHVEMKVTPDGPKMVEMGARMGGDNITTSLVPLSTGIDMVKATIDMALGGQPDMEPTLRCGSAIRFFRVPSGIIRSIRGVEEARAIPGVREIVFTKGIGDESVPVRCSNDRVGFVTAQAATAGEAVKVCGEAMKIIDIVVG